MGKWWRIGRLTGDDFLDFLGPPAKSELLSVGRHPVHTTNYILEIEESKCNGCGQYVDAFPAEAMAHYLACWVMPLRSSRFGPAGR